ncbi:nucleoside-diphosphate-sugar epimerase [Salinibacter ruber]|uniref:Nucleoside-diphosphate-sugar epimerase n=1 Tax=Salinibacter ruber TaxID=146919 RepID=A0A9X2U2Z5_9BACT|nr:nucleoside-diphosphate-sugar epimerase [Salinibacter ruber]MCS3864616.1 nucleoside-diphosphate-sugar epimerase [Salinibacter ruber]
MKTYGDGEQTFNFIHSDELTCSITLTAKQLDVGSETYKIGTNAETTVSDLTAQNVEILREDLDVDGVNVIHTELRTRDVRPNYSDTS